MIKVVLTKNDEEYSAFEISGHAESGPYGYDLVCAAVSAISFGTVNALFSIGGFEPNVKQHEHGGYLYVELPSSLSNEQMKKAQIIIQTMVISLQTIEREYRQFIQIQ